MHSINDLKHVLQAGVFIFIFLIFLPGCGTHFYNKADDDLAKKAQAAFTDSKLSESLVAERARLKELLDKELQAVRRETSASRNLRLINIIGYADKNSWEYFEDEIAKGFERLQGDVAIANTEAVELAGLLPKIKEQEDNMSSSLELYRIYKEKSDPPLKCPMKDESNATKINPIAKQFYENFRLSCLKYTALNSAFQNYTGEGLIGAMNREIKEVNSEYSQFSMAVETEAKAYDQKRKELKDAQSKESNSKIAEAAKALKDQLDKIEKPLPDTQKLDAVLSKIHLEDLKLDGLAKKIKLQKDNIDEILGAIVKDDGDITTDPSAETKLYIKLAKYLPEFEKIIDHSLSYPQVHYLLLESENLRLQLETVKRRLENAEGRLSLMKLKGKALLTEFIYLLDSQKF